MAQKNIAPVARTVDQLVTGVKKDLLWLLVSAIVAIGAAVVVNTALVI